MYSSDPYDDSIERDRGALIGKHNHDDPCDEDEGHDVDMGEERDPELWGQQLPLIEEDIDDGIKMDDFSKESIPRIIDAMGDESADPIPESPNGTSATGTDSPLMPDHGGFPERE